MKRLIVLNRFFFPDHSATSQILTDLMLHFAASGVEVHVITSQQLYDDPSRQLPAKELLGGISVHRIPTTRFGRSGLAGRAVDYFSFYASAGRSMRALLAPGDVLLAMTDPPLISIIAMWVARLRKAHLVNWLQDLYPEIAVQLGVPFLKRPLASGIAHFRDRSLKSAALNVVLGQTMREKLIARGISPTCVTVISNWADDDEIFRIDPADNPLRQKWGLQHKFVVGYSGNLGRAHEFETVLAAAVRLRTDPRIVFLFIGSGHRMDELARIVKARGLESTFRFFPYQDRALLKYSLSAADVHWISLKPALEGLIVPSKFYGIAAAGRPIIAITARDGEIARLVQEHNCGLVIEPGQAEQLALALQQLSTDAPSLVGMGLRARAMLEAHFSRQHAFNRWSDMLNKMVYEENRAPSSS